MTAKKPSDKTDPDDSRASQKKQKVSEVPSTSASKPQITSPKAGGAATATTETRSMAARESNDSARPGTTPGIDAMEVVRHSEEEKRAAESERPRTAPHVTAAQAIAKAMQRDHPDTGRPSKKPAAPTEKAVPQPPRVADVPEEPKEPIAGIGAEGLPPPVVDTGDVEALLNAEHRDPFSFLGMHAGATADALTVRVFQPGATEVAVLDGGVPVAHLDRVHDEGLFVGAVQWRKSPFAYRLRIKAPEGEKDVEDPYRFGPVLTEEEARSLEKSYSYTSYRCLGAHPTEVEGVKGVSFAVWAPNAYRVSVVGDFNDWDGRRHGMRFRHECGVWEIFIPGVDDGDLYRYEIKAKLGTDPFIKSDPFAFCTERPPATASRVADVIGSYAWQDKGWMDARASTHGAEAPVCFYEVHLGSWRRKPEENDRWLTYRELADELVAYVKDTAFTHIALLPVSEHTYDDTVGYLPSALFAPSSRYGTPDDFRFLVDTCHQAGIGVVVDWVPNFLSIEPQGLALFDGTPLYEDTTPYHERDPDWDMPLFDLSSPRVVNYLLSNAYYWLEQYHLDGLRIDSVAKLIYLDYGRQQGQWTPNEDGGNESFEALDFLRRFNQMVRGAFPGVLTVAEDSSLRQGLTKEVKDGGLGFSLRWNSSWAYDTLRYLKRHPVHRKYYHHELIEPVRFAFDERFVLPLSHDHVSIGQGAMVNKIPGDRWQRLATLRAWLGLMYALPGKKLLFMATEFAQDREWNSTISLDWHLLQDPMHLGVQRLIRDFNRLIQESPALHERDGDATGFEWIDTNDEDCSVVSFARYSRDNDQTIVAVTHFTPVIRPNYRIGVPASGFYREVLNTDAEAYGGGNSGSGGGAVAEHQGTHGREFSVALTLPPYATVLLKLEPDRPAST